MFLKLAAKFILLITFFVPLFCFSQITTQNTEFKSYFIKKFIEVDPPGSIFNILIIKNNTNTETTINTKFSYPEQWTLIGINNSSFKIPANDSIIVPLRVSVSGNTKGGVANVIGVNITNDKQKTVASSFCYANIMKKNNLQINTEKNIYHLKYNQESSIVKYRIQNKGNINEVVSFNLKSPAIFIPEGSVNNELVRSFNISPFTDTTVEFKIINTNHKKFNFDDDLNRIYVEISNNEKIIKQSIWFKALKSYYYNELLSLIRPLTVEIRMSDFTSKVIPSFYTNLYGRIYLRPKGDLYYYFNNTNTSIFNKSDLYSYLFKVGYQTEKYFIEIGDLDDAIINNYMKGVAGGFQNKKISLRL